MKKIFKHSMMLLLSVLALVLGSCTEEFEYTGTTIEGEQVYFSNTLPATIDLDRNAGEVRIPVNRIQRSGQLTVNLTVTTSENCAVNVPSSVTFADGDSVAYLSISYDPAAIELGHYDNVTLAIADSAYTTPYGAASYTFQVGLSEWQTMGNGLYRDVLFANFYGLEELTYNVEIQQSVITPGIYRVVSPYGPGTDFYTQYIATGILGWVGGSNTSLMINATDPDFVYVTGEFYPGTDDGMGSQGYGVMHLFSIIDEEVKAGNTVDAIKRSNPELFGTMVDGMITLPKMSVYVNFDNSYESLGYIDTQNWAIALPGSSFTDYSSSFTYTGRFTDVAGNNYAEGNVTLGEDVANAKYVVAMQGDDVNAIIDAINDGSLEADAITESGEVSIPISETGDYVLIIVTYDAEGNQRGSSTTPFTFTIGGGEEEADWQFVCNGTYYHAFENLFSDAGPLFEDQPSYTTTLYQDANDPTRYKIDPYSVNPSMPLTFEFTMDANGTIAFENVETGYVTGDNQGNEYTIWGTDAAVISDGQWSSSYFAPEYNTYYFAQVYFIIMDGQMQLGWGEWDAFVPDGAAQNVLKSPAKKGLKLGSKIKPAKIGLKGFTTSKYGKAVKLNRK